MPTYEKEAASFIHDLKEVYKSEIMKQFNLYAQGEMVVLIYLMHHEEEPSLPSEIGKATNTSPARVAAILKSLEKKNYISREMDLKDRRKIRVEITQTGKEKALHEKSIALGRMEKIFAEMGEEATNQLINSVETFKQVSRALYAKEHQQKESENKHGTQS
ncbi:MarR family winged helix-turn-helix transcriptional regulator [Lactococcus nasutitermitis]|uniref:HTH-type transcriptional regulator SarZ n=1 Tax=Lactococcus nasutitermitis TaxID=1652957 RepID=A0ABV9JCR3_9LACT|nr:MarR family winged helix-turn-helix transcriptional regulator [Lactococcus nasutitermitis]